MAETISATITVKDNLSSAIKSMSKAVESLCSQFAALDKAIEGSAANMSAVSKAMSGINAGAAEKAAEAFSAVEKQSSSAAEAVSDVTDAMNSVNTGGAEKAAQAVEQVSEESKAAAEAVEGIGDAFNSLGSNNVNVITVNINKAGKEADEAKSKVSALADQLERAAAAAAKITLKGLGVAFGAAATGVAAITKSSVSAYADYQQYEGGVQTLFGAGGQSVEDYATSVGKSVEKVQASYDKLMAAQDAVMNNAKQAYMTAGVSANDYMDMATQLSASLVSSLGGDTQKAADKVERAIVDMSDNANKMGTTMESIQNAYKGFAKQNYTMLDNLKLGYGGTKEEMKRLLSDAEKRSGVKYDISSLSDMIDAIHVIQENMGITGTTELEAKETISGSWNALKAAWSNTLTSMVEGGEWFDQCIDALVNTAVTFGENIMPAIEGALSGLGQLIERLAPILEEHLPVMIENILPSLITAATSLVKAFIKTLPSIFSAVVDALPDVISQIGDAIAECFADIPIVSKIGEALSKNAEGLGKALPYILGIAGGSGLMVGLASKIKSIADLFGGGFGKTSSGGGLLSWLSSLAKANTTSVLKGIANIGIIIGGLSALVLAYGALTKIPGFTELMSSGASELLSLTPAFAAMTAVATVASLSAKIPVTSALKGLANIGIIIGGLTAIVAAFGALTKIPGFSDMMSAGGQQFLSLIPSFAAIAAVGMALSAVSAVVGKIPVSSVALGLANMAIMIGGMTAMVAAYGALTKIPGFSDMMSSGAEEFKSLIEIMGIMEVVGSAMAGLSAVVGMVPVASVALGLANIAAALGGMTAIVAAFGGLTKIPGFTELMSSGAEEFESLAEVFTQIGLVGGTLAGIAAIFGATSAISIPAIATGMGAIATAIGLAGTIVAAFGGLSKIPGYTEFMQGGIDALKQLFSGLSEIVGSLIGGFAEGLSEDFPTIGENLSSFAEKAATFFTTLSGVDISGTASFLSGIADLLSTLVSSKVQDVLTNTEGMADLDTLGSKLTSFAVNMKGFFNNVKDIPDESFAKAEQFFHTLSYLSELPNSGGIGDWFSGSVEYDKIADGLGKLGGEGVAAFFNMAANIPEGALDGAVQIFETLKQLDGIPTEGGAKGGLFGNLNLTNIADGLSALAPAITAFNDAVSNVTDVSKFTEMFDALKKMNDITLPTEGGLFNQAIEALGGTTSWDAFATNLRTLGRALHSFSDLTKDINASSFSKIIDTCTKLNDIEIPTKLGQDVSDKLTGGTDWDAFSTNLTKLADGINQFAGDTANVNTEQLSGVVTELTGIVEALNALNTDMATLQAVDLSGLLTAFDGMNESITAADTGLLTILTTVQTVADGLYVWIEYIGTMVDTGFLAISESVTTALTNIVTVFSTGFAGVADTVYTWMSYIGTVIDTAFLAITTSISAQMVNISTAFATAFAGAADTVYIWMGYIGTQIDTGLAAIIVSVTTKMTEFTTALDTGFNQAVALAQACATNIQSALNIDTTSIGVNIVQGMINGINSKSGELIATAQSLASQVASTINSALDIGSPSRLTFETGKFVVMGLGEGLLSEVGWLQRQIGEVTNVTASVGGSERDWSAIRESAGNSFTYNTERTNNPVTVYMTNSNSISNDMDIETVARKLANGIRTQMHLEMEGA